MAGRLPPADPRAVPVSPDAPVSDLPTAGPPFPVAPDDRRLPAVEARLAARLRPALARALRGSEAAWVDQLLRDLARFTLRWQDGHAADYAADPRHEVDAPPDPAR